MVILERLLDHLIQTGYEDIPKKAIDAAERHTIDYIGALVAGSSIKYVEKVFNVYKRDGGAKECSVIEFGEKLPAVSAVAINTTMARAHDIDDVHEEAVAHIGVAVMPAIFASIEKRLISGQEFLTAVALGYDIASRFCLGAIVPPGKSGMNIGYHAATLTCALLYGKLLGLNKEKLRNAAGIAFCEMSGTDQCLLEGSNMVAVQQGLSCAKGIRSAQLADSGIIGPHEIFSGIFGYFNTYQHGQYNLGAIVNKLGSFYHGTQVSTKLYPCCKFAHSAIEGCLDICNGRLFESDDIEKVVVHLTRQAFTFTCEPIEKKRYPKNVIEAKFSLPYIIAYAIRNGKVWIDAFSEKAIKDRKTLALTGKVIAKVDEKIEKEHSDVIGPSEIEITFSDGTMKRSFVRYVKGHPNNPLNSIDINEKINKCLDLARKTISDEKREELMHNLSNIKDLKDVSVIIESIV